MYQFRQFLRLSVIGILVFIILISSSLAGNSTVGVSDTTTLTTTPVPKIPSIYTSCTGKTINCIGVKIDDDRDPVNPECRTGCNYVATFNSVGGRIWLTLYSNVPSGYVAGGISVDEKMGHDIVVVCVRRSNSTRPIVYLSWNVGPRNHRLEDQSMLRYEYGLISNGMFCNVSLPTTIKINDLYTVELRGREKHFHWLLAGGEASDESIFYHKARVSSIRVIIEGESSGGINGTQADYAAEQIHGGYMIFSWIVWIPCGSFMSRFYKETWRNVYIWGKRPWFVGHTFCMVFAVVMSLTAYVLVRYESDVWLPIEEPATFHGIIGYTTLGLLVLQCLVGWFRPSGAAGRYRSSKLHCFLGASCYLLGLVNIGTAPMFTQNVLPCSATVIVIVWFVLHLVLYTTMTAYIFWTDWHLQLGGWRAIFGYPMPITTSEEAVRPKLRKGFLGLFILTSLSCGFALIYSMKFEACPPTFNLECNSTVTVSGINIS